jgi:predicted phosphodiesterase
MKYLQVLVFLFFSTGLTAQQQDFLVKPYLQIGKKPSPQSLQLFWHATDANATWVAEYKNNNTNDWIKAINQTTTKIAVAGNEQFWIYSTSFSSLIPGTTFSYRVSKNGSIVFTAEAKSLKAPEQSYRMIITGDIASGSKQAARIANGMYNSNPDMIAIAGDIVYTRGLISEYKTRYWPVYNKDIADSGGAPLLRSIPFLAAVGNHDAITRDLDAYPGALAYYHYWEQPLNGPDGKEGGTLVPTLKASDANRKAFIDGAGEKYPKMSNFSFDYGNAHWTVLDSNPYVEWSDSLLKDWVIKDLASAQNATWRFVLMHHPGFNSSKAHYEQQQMRLLSPIFEKGKVDIVFAGHVHNYQRSYPMTFTPVNNGNQLVAGANNIKTGKIVNGTWTLDKNFNGKGKTKPQGVIYIVTGAGGQSLYNPEQTKDKDSWQKFTVKFESRVNSFTIMDVNGKTLTLKQIDINGEQVDKIKITK